MRTNHLSNPGDAAKTLGIDYGTSVVINCPVCHRTIWRASICTHGKVPEHKDDFTPKEAEIPEKPVYRPKTRDKKRREENENGGEG